MRRETLQFGPRLRRWFYGVMLALFASGVAWLILPSDADAPHPLAPTLLRIHGAAAMAALVILGMLVPLHIRRGWQARINRPTGSVMLASFTLLVATGYALYYSGGEQLRRAAALTHDTLGVALPLLLVWHIARGRTFRR